MTRKSWLTDKSLVPNETGESKWMNKRLCIGWHCHLVAVGCVVLPRQWSMVMLRSFALDCVPGRCCCEGRVPRQSGFCASPPAFPRALFCPCPRPAPAWMTQEATTMPGQDEMRARFGVCANEPMPALEVEDKVGQPSMSDHGVRCAEAEEVPECLGHQRCMAYLSMTSGPDKRHNM
mmetsp:Transcript_73011/g.205683  ORF Transcript_73011/g.205683 Transcript_73011/m.205683 type:complete len:177 (+) Transcript_73011:224-754(+)